MKTRTLLVVMVAAMALVGCKKKGTKKGKKGTVAVKKESKKLNCKPKYLRKYKNGKVERCTLAEDYTVGGITCKKGSSISFRKGNGKLDSCTLAMPQTVEGNRCAAKDINFYSDGKLKDCYLKKPRKINGVMCSKKTAFHHTSGKLSYCDLAKSTVIGGFPCKADTASFNTKGKLYLCYLSKELVVGGAKLSKGTKMQPYGGPSCEYAETMKGSTIKFKAYGCKEMHFQKSGEPKKCKLASTVKIGDKEIPANKWVCFNKSGKAVSGSGCVTL